MQTSPLTGQTVVHSSACSRRAGVTLRAKSTVYRAGYPPARPAFSRAASIRSYVSTRKRVGGSSGYPVNAGRVPSADAMAEYQKSCDDIGDGHSHKTQRIRGPARVVSGKPPRSRNGQIDRNVRWRRDGGPVDARNSSGIEYGSSGVYAQAAC